MEIAQSSSYTNRDSPARILLNPHEEALQSLCKQLLKTRIFRGYYLERRYVQPVLGYRDIVALQRGERDLEKLLIDIGQKLQLFYEVQRPNMWIGMTTGKLTDAPVQPGALDTHIWAELSELAYGQYWFSIKSVRFREREIILKLKMVRAVENDAPEVGRVGRTRLSIANSVGDVAEAATTAYKRRSNVGGNEEISNTTLNDATTFNDCEAGPKIELHDFMLILQQWGNSIKQTIYDFMSNDISKQNIVGFMKFLGLFVFTLLSGALYAVRYLGVFTLRFMFELSRLLHVSTPILLKIIDVFNKIVGGFYILLTMVWKDAVINRGQSKTLRNQLEYNATPPYRSIEYNVQQLPRPTLQQPPVVRSVNAHILDNSLQQ